jgi:hypothetical protein
VVGILTKPAGEMSTPPSEHTRLRWCCFLGHPRTEASSGGALMTQQDRWWIAISIVWLFLTLGVLLYLGYA